MMRWYLLVLVLVFVVTLAAVVGLRVQAEGSAFVVGLVCGAALSLPAGLLVAHLLRRSRAETPQPRPLRYPPVVILNAPPPARAQQLPDYPPQWQQPPAAGTGAGYHVIGGNDG